MTAAEAASDTAAELLTARTSTVRSVRDALLGTLRTVVTAAVSLAVVIGLWQAFLKVFHVKSLVGKSPLDVWRYVASDPGAAGHRSHLLHGLWQTLADAGVGYLAGLVGGMAVAVLFVLFRPVERALLPLAIVVRSVPLIAMTPLIILVFGRGITGTAVIVGIVVFFPALVTICFGLRSASRQATELCRAYGAGRWTVARKVMVPSSLPALFASARVAVPGAIVGAMIAEWLSTGRGLGYAMATDPNNFDYVHLWASVVLLTVVSALAYFLLAAVEAVLLARFGPDGAGR